MQIVCVLIAALLAVVRCEKTEREAAFAARQLLDSTIHAELSSIVKSSEKPNANGYVYGSLEYIAPDCTSNNGDVLLYLADMSMEGGNVQADSSHVSLTIRDLTYYNDSRDRKPGVMDRARLSLMGEVSVVPDELVRICFSLEWQGHKRLFPELQLPQVERCFFTVHPDAKYWKYAHVFRFWLLKPRDIYWVGGFGSRHYIGWIGIDLYRSETSETKLVNQPRRRRSSSK
ncbi:hypothetical protein SeMB42_g03577 [Synchytrium endobioticum]|uniref:CREG-like beta-barrel domain-containing protein n=1 Tax=Synchytrium endobioticum TaxID=286115 RepID=A0A507D7D2_9FUNG|nr:hypothetical protein SeMB42_g03577 [Synchytrium endobioticum]